MKSIASVAVLAVILMGSPVVIGAAQRALTIDSLEKGYAARIQSIDAEIASTTPPVKSRRTDKNSILESLDAIKYQAQLDRLAREKEETEAAYKLLQESFR